MVKRFKRTHDRHFQELASRVKGAIDKNDGLIGDQKEQVDLLFSLERKFKFYVQKYQKTADIYKQFVLFILNEEENILSARPYFREKAAVFSEEITCAIKNSDIQTLMKFNINYQLINFMAKRWGGPFPIRVQRYYDDFLEARRVLIENNLPLAINRAKLFYRKVPKSHLNLLDLIDICTCGLISGVDKYSGPYTKVWRSVCIGRMVGNMIEEYSKTFIRMYPTDKKILYRANSLKYRLKIENTIDLTNAVNESFIDDKREGKKIPNLPISEVHIRTLMNGSSYISADVRSNDENEDGSGGGNIYDYTASPDNVEDNVIKKDLMNKINNASHDLEVIERKIIRLKGVDL